MHIHRGDIYEMNYCMEFYAEEVEIDPYETYLHVSQSFHLHRFPVSIVIVIFIL